MKKNTILSLLLALVMLMAACGGPSGTGESNNNEETGNQGTPANDYSVDDLGRSFGATIDETVLVDEQGVKITAKELSYSSYAADLSLLIENNSDRQLSFYAGTLGYSANSINGYMISDGYIGEDVAAGMAVNVNMSFNLDQLSFYGFKDIADIGLGFQIKDGYDDYLVTGPLEIRTSVADSYDYSKDTYKEAMDNPVMPAVYGFTVNYKADDVLYDGNGIRILNEYVVTNKAGEQSIFIELQNTSDQNLYATATDAVVNNITCSFAAASEFIVPGKRSVMSISLENLLDKNYMEKIGMKEYQNFLCYFGVKDEDYNAIGGKDIEIQFAGDVRPEDFEEETVYDANGFKVMDVGIVEDGFEYSDDLHLLLLVKNETDKVVSISDGLNDVYINKMKISDITIGQDARPNNYALIDVELMGYDLEANGIEISNITEAMVTLEIRDNDYTLLDSPTIELTY